ncbi:hypothetical protein QTP88_012939 [Uroleucon formosanum]
MTLCPVDLIATFIIFQSPPITSKQKNYNNCDLRTLLAGRLLSARLCVVVVVSHLSECVLCCGWGLHYANGTW